ncbi:MAG: hypothetical protein Kow0037_11120 [Calditrichia bacterium]
MRKYKIERRGKFRGFIFYLLYLGLVVFLALEVIIRIWDPFDINHFFELTSCLKKMERNPVYEYTQKPGFFRQYKNFTLHINSQGFRGEEILPKRPNQKRLLLIGDSMVLGWGVPDSLIFPNIWRRWFARQYPDWDVIAAGVISWNTRNEVEFLIHKGMEYQPDAVVFLAFANDVIPKHLSYTEVPKEKLFPGWHPKQQPPLWKRWVKAVLRPVVYNSYALTTFLYLAVWGNENEGLEKYYTGHTPAWEDTRRAVIKLKRFCQENQLPLHLELGLYENSQAPEAIAYRKKWTAFLDSLQINYNETVVAFSKPALRNSVMDGHPNAAGHRLIAREFFRHIQYLFKKEKK